MCDDRTDADSRPLAAMSRRDVVALAGSVALTWASQGAAAAPKVVGRAVDVTTPDGKANAWFAAPARGRLPAVLMWPDIYGLRPAYQQMAERLAASGYAVLAINPFYRSTRGSVIGPGEAKDAGTRARIMPMRALLTAEAANRDTRACIAFLHQQKNVDPRAKAAVIGYCMGGPISVRAAAAEPEKVGAVCSFHGGALATEDAGSPHRSIAGGKARFFIAVAQNDDRQFPEDKVRLRSAFDAAGRSADIKVYPALHGWCPPDSPTYDAAQADDAWGRMLALLSKSLVRERA